MSSIISRGPQVGDEAGKHLWDLASRDTEDSGPGGEGKLGAQVEWGLEREQGGGETAVFSNFLFCCEGKKGGGWRMT